MAVTGNIVTGVCHAHPTSSGWWTTPRVLVGYINNYDGTIKDYVTKITITIPSNITIVSTNSLRLNIPLSGDSKPYDSLAFITDQAIAPSAVFGQTGMATSPPYYDKNGTLTAYPSGWSSSIGSPAVIYNFNMSGKTLKAGGTYYVYIYAKTLTSETTKLHGANNSSGLANYTGYIDYVTNYTITYNANGGSGTGPTSATVSPGSSYQASPSCGFIAPTGYYWSSTWIDQNGSTYAAGARVVVNSDMVLKPVWQAISYTISYLPNGGNGPMPQNYSVLYDQYHNVIQNPFSFGYTIYYVLEEGEPYYDADTGYLTFVNWADSNGTPYNPGQQVKNLTATNGATVNMTANWKGEVTLPSPTKEGYIFRGWKNYREHLCEGGSKYTPYSASETLYAQWDEIDGYYENIVYVKVDGTWLLSSH